MFQKHCPNINLNGHGRFDSMLDNGTPAFNGNLDLVITVKVFLRQNGMAVSGERRVKDWNGNWYLVSDWNPAEWRKFATEYQTTGQQFWDNKFWLQTPWEYLSIEPTFRYEYQHTLNCYTTQGTGQAALLHCTIDSGRRLDVPGHRRVWRKRNINCRFRLELVPAEGQAHHGINVFNITHYYDGSNWIAIRPGYPSRFRSDAGNYTNKDLLESVREFEGHRIVSRTHIHELGHAIGLEHAGIPRREQKCLNEIEKEGREKGNGHFMCYAASLDSASDVMGFGMNLSQFDALPWQKAVSEHTKLDVAKWESSVHRELRPNFIYHL